MASTVEPEWDEQQRHLMLALQLYRDGLCSLCGWPSSVCQSPDLDMANRIRANLPVRCNVMTKVDIAQHADGADKYPQPRALLWGARFEGTI